MRNANQELGIQNTVIAVNDVVNGHRIHVMNDDSTSKIMSFDTKIASFVSDDNLVS